MSSIRNLIVVAGLVSLVAPAAFAQTDEPPVESQPPAKMAAPSPAESAAGVGLSEAASEEPETHVARAVFTTAVADREPSDELSVIPSSTGRVYFFTELRDLEGQRVTHRWQQGGELRAEVSFDVGGPRWRVWSSKEILPEWTGEWRVTVLDESGAELATRSFSYQAQE